jgi:hypothetical protein
VKILNNKKAILTVVGLVIILIVGSFTVISSMIKDSTAAQKVTAEPATSSAPEESGTSVPTPAPSSNPDTSITNTYDPVASKSALDPLHPQYIKGLGYEYKDDADFSISEYGTLEKAETAANDYGLSIYGIYYLTENKDGSTITGYHVHTYTMWFDYLLDKQGTEPPAKTDTPKQ